MKKSNVAYIQSLNFDFIRTCGVVIVLATHLLIYHGNPVFKGIEFSLFGELAIIFFFVHSAWVLMMSLERQTDKYGGHRFFSYFFVRRLFRIFPLSIFVVGLIAIFKLPMVKCGQPMISAELNSEQLLANFLLMENFYKASDILGPLWSLAVEFQAYLFFPFAYLLLRKTKGYYPLVFAWSSLCFVLVAIVPKINKVNTQMLDYYQIPDIFEWLPCFVAGMIAYKIAENSKKTWPFYTIPLFVVAALPIYALVWDFSRGYFVSIGIAILLTQAVEMKNPWLIKISKLGSQYSYSSYLGHYFAMFFAFEYMSSMPLSIQWGLFTIAMVVVCLVGHHLVEKPGIRIGAYLASKLVKDVPLQNVHKIKEAS